MDNAQFLQWLRTPDADDQTLEQLTVEVTNQSDRHRIMAEAELARRNRDVQKSTKRIARWTLIVAGLGVAVTVAGIVLAQCAR